MIIALCFAVLGAILASFVGVIVERVNTGASWTTDRSRCDSCATELTARDLIPVVSWLISRGVCRTCGSRIPVRLVVIEASMAVFFFASYQLIGATVALPFFLVSLLLLLFVVLYDIRHTIVPMGPVLLFIFSALVYRALYSPASLGASLLFAGLAASVFLLFHLGSRGRAMGLGDAPVVLGLSLLVGASVTIPGVLFSFWIGAVYGIVVLARTPQGHRMGIEVPFVPFLALGFLLALYTGWNPLPLFS